MNSLQHNIKTQTQKQQQKKNKNFLNNASNYSEVDYLKINLLKPNLELYNNYYKSIQNNKNIFFEEEKYVIPNNNIKYYLFVVNKQNITSLSRTAIKVQNPNSNSNLKILYFFPHNETNNNSDFFVEIDDNQNIFNKENYLFEGYLYGELLKKDFLITDLLIINSKPLECNYGIKFDLINQILFNNLIFLQDLNGYLSINIHPTFKFNNIEDRSDEMFKIFVNNFIYSKDITTKELIYNNNYKISYKENDEDNNKNKNTLKKIKKGKYTDVYNVYDDDNNFEGILYIKTIDDSQKMRKLFESTINEYIFIKCSYNIKFKKWQPILI